MVNAVPDLCVIQVDRRLLPDETSHTALREIQDALARDPEIDFDVETRWTRELAGIDTPEDSPAARCAMQACRRVLGRCSVTGVSYGTEAAFFAAAGIPCVVLGPGDVRVAHSDHEHVSLEEVEKSAEVYLEIMRG